MSPQTHQAVAEVKPMFSPRGLVPSAACAILLLSACTGVTEITAPIDEPASTDEPTELALVDDTATDGTDSTDSSVADSTAGPTDADPIDAATPEPIATVDTTTVDLDDPAEQPDWVFWDIDDVYSMDVPGHLDTRLWFDDELKLFVEESKDTGLTFPRQLIAEYDKILKTSQGIVFIGPDGDALTAHRSFGAANALVYHDKTASDLTLQYSGFASNVDFTSEPRMFDETPGVLIRGTYDVEDDRWYYYSFHTHVGAYLYFFTVTLTGDDDPDMVAEFFRSVDITG